MIRTSISPQGASSVPVAADSLRDVHLWRVALDDHQVLTPARLEWLDRSEQARAERFYGQAAAQRWRVAHVALRAILAEVTGQRPEDLTFAVGTHGKPSLVGDGMPAFNLSHAVDLAVIAVGGTDTLGVDVEHVADAPDLADIALTHFAEEEVGYIATLDSSERVRAFYQCWTRKEAFVKALGVGIGYDLQSFAVSLDAGDVRLLRTQSSVGAPESWTLAELQLEGPYVGALAVQARDLRITVAEWLPR